MIILGIESSCDETGAALVTDDGRILAERLSSQLEAHKAFGGVVPEIAARFHLDILDVLIDQVMEESGCGYDALDGVAVTAGPGLIGGLLVGMMTGKAIAAVHRVPFLAVNHLEAHALTVRLIEDVSFPYLLLLISGGHCQLLVVEDVGRYRRLGTTVDDALGEAFDKVAKLMGLEYPGGPMIEKAALSGDPKRFPLPRPMMGRPGCHFSFSGLKTATRHVIAGFHQQAMTQQDIADVAACFQAAAGDVLQDRIRNAIAMTRNIHPEAHTLVVAGGVAANQYLRGRITAAVEEEKFRMIAAPLRLCTDNGVMVAWAGIERLKRGFVDDFTAKAHPRWPLDPNAEAVRFAGVKA